jgi:hypothetical protein
MFSQVLASLSRLIPRSPQIVVATSDSEHESGWHTSSWELAQGLQVIEITAADDKPSFFADTLPAWYPPATQAA